MTNPTTLLGGNIKQVNENNTADDSAAGITRLANGNYVVVWFNEDTSGSGSFGVYAREYHADGTPAYDSPYGDEVLITADASPDTVPAVAAWGSGFVVYWANADQDGWVRQYFDNTGGHETAYAYQDDEFQRGFGVTTLGDGNQVAFMNNFDYVTYRAGDEGGTPSHDLDLDNFGVLDTGGRHVDSVTPVALTGGGYVALMAVHDGPSDHEYVAIQVLNDDGTAVSNFTPVTDTANSIAYSAAVALDDGGFVVVWSGSDGEDQHLFAQRYNADGTADGSEQTLVSDDREKRHVTAATLSDGTYVIVWMQNIYGDDDHYHILAQRYSAAGAALGGTITVETDLLQEDQGLPRVVAGDDGGFTVAWTGADDGDGTGIFQRSYAAPSADGDQVVNTHTTGDQGDSVTTRLSDGSYVTVWLDSDAGDLRGQHFDATGQATGAEFGLGAGAVGYYAIGASGTGFTAYWNDGAGVSSRTFDSAGTPTGSATHIVDNFSDYPYVAANLADGGHVFVANGYDPDVGDEALFVWSDVTEESFTLAAGATRPAVTGLPNGGYVITWQIFDPSSLTYHAEAQMFAADGTPTSAVIDVAEGGFDGWGGAGETAPVVTALANGDILVVWRAVVDGSNELFSRRYDAAGHAVDGVSLVSNTTESWTPSVATLADGGYVVSWVQWTGSDYSIVAQRFYASGMPAYDKVIVNTVADGDQGYPTVHALDNGGFVVGWSSSSGGEDGDGGGVFQKVYDGGSLPPDLGARHGDQQVNTTTAGDQTTAKTVELSDGTYVTVWADGADLHGQHFDENGHALDSEFMVAGACGTSIPPIVTALGTGGFAVFWSDGSEPAYQVFAADGSTAGATVFSGFNVNPGDTFAGLAATGLAGGGAVVNALVYDSDMAPYKVGWTLNASGTPASATILSVASEGTTFHALAGGGFFEVVASDTSIFICTFNAFGNPVTSLANIAWDGVSGGVVSAAGLSGGGFVVAWTVDDGDGVHIHTLMLDGSGNPVTGEMGISRGSADSAPAVAGLDDGGYVVVWQADAGDGSQDIMAERFDAHGVMVSSPFVVNTVVAGDQVAPTVAALGNGGFVVSWTGGGNQDGSGEGIFQKVYVPYEYSPNLTGAPAMLDDVAANHTATISTADLLQGYTDVEGDTLMVTGLTADHGTIQDNGDGTFTLTPDGAYTGTVTLSYTVDDGGIGTTAASATLEVIDAIVTEDNQVNMTSAGDQDSVALATFSDGSYIAVWHSDGQDGDAGGIYAQVFGANGIRSGGEFQINDTAAGDQVAPAVAVLADDGFVIGWISDDAITLRTFTAYGTPVGIDTPLSGDFSEPSSVKVMALDGGGYAVSWFARDGDSNKAVFSATFDADGDPVQPVTEISSPDDIARAITLIPLAGGGYVAIAELYDSHDGTDYLLSRSFSADGTPGLTTTQVTTSGQNATHSAGAALDDGGYVVVWQEDSGGLHTIQLQRYDDTGAPVDSIVDVTDGTVDSTVPVVTGLPDGGYVVVWQALGQDGDGASIVAQRYDAAGAAVGHAEVINDTGSGDQTAPSVTVADGGYVVSWTDSSRDGDGTGVFQKMVLDPVMAGWGPAIPLAGGDNFSDIVLTSADLAGGYADGNHHGYTLAASDLIADHAAVVDNGDGTFTLTPEAGYTGLVVFSYRLDDGHGNYIYTVNAINVVGGLRAAGEESAANAYIPDMQIHAATTVLNDGTYVTAWQSRFQDGDEYGIYLKHFDVNGVPIGLGGKVNLTTAGSQIDPTVTALAGGGYVVGWASQDHDGITARAQVFTNGGSKVGVELTLTAAQANLTNLSFAALDTGGFVAVWTASGASGEHADYTYAQVFDAAGGTVHSAERVDDNDGNQEAPSVATIDGGFIVVWQVYDDDNGSQDVYSRIYDSCGCPAGPAEQVNTHTGGDQEQPAVTGLADGGWIIVWQSHDQDGDGTGIYSQRYDYCGCPNGDETLVETTTAGDQRNPVVASLADGGYVIVWESNNQDGDGWGIFYQRYDEFGDRIGGETQVNDYTVGDEGNPTVTGLADGGFTISWDSPADGSQWGIQQKVYYTWTPVFGDGDGNLLDGRGIDADMRGGAGDDTYFVDSASDMVHERVGEGTDAVVSWIDYTLPDNVETLALTGTSAVHAFGNSLNNLIGGNDGNNVLDGKGGADQMYGGAGNDTYYVRQDGDVVSEHSSSPDVDDGGIDKVYAYVDYTLGDDIENLTLNGTDTINGTGNGLNNVVRGNSNNNMLWGLDGNDTLDGQGGADIMYGGAGNDVYFVRQDGDVASEESTLTHDDGGIDRVYAYIDYTLGNFIENLTLSGTDAIDGTGNTLNNIIHGNAGDNTLWGLDGDDTLQGYGGHDTLYGGAGNDTYTINDDGDVASEDSTQTGHDDGGIDKVYAYVDYTLGAFIENLTLNGTGDIDGVGNASNNVIHGNSGSNTLWGLDGNDTLDGQGGLDTLYGGAGNDTYYVRDDGDVASEESTGIGNDDGGIDKVYAYVDYVMGAFIENLTLNGTDAINGTGNDLDNVIHGNSNDNVLTGGAGNDTLQGFGGADTFVFGACATNGKDKIVDFTHGSDHLRFTGADYGFDTGHSLSAGELTIGTTAAGSLAQFVFNASNHTLYWDSNGAEAGGLTALAVLSGVTSLDASDFLFT